MSLTNKFVLGIVTGMALGLVANKAFSDERQTITLEKKNTVSLREEYNQSSVDAVKAKLIELSHTLPANQPIYLYLNTPGGSVVAGSNLITVIHGIKNPVNVIASFAASMGYLTTQGTTGKRYVTPDGILMAHRAYLGVEGQTPGEIGTRLAFFEKTTNDLAAMAAARTGITASAYQAKVVKEYWVQGQDAVNDKQADAVVNVACSADLNGTYGERLYTMFGPVDIEWADCPLINSPVSVQFQRAEFSGISELEYANFQQTVMNMLTKSKIDIVNDELLQSNFIKYVR